jgi:hypothetical protein
MQPKFTIVATDKSTGDRFVCFTWTRDAESGIARAKSDAVKFAMADALENFRAEVIYNAHQD